MAQPQAFFNNFPTPIGPQLPAGPANGSFSSFPPSAGPVPNLNPNPQAGISSGGNNGQTLGVSTFNPGPNPLDAAAQAEQARASAETQGLNTQFDYQATQLNNQLPFLEAQKNDSFNSLDLGYNQLGTQVGSQKAASLKNADEQTAQAGDTAHSTIRQNRGVLRALGILNSSAAGDILTKPLTEFDKQRVQLYTAHQDRVNQLDTTLNQALEQVNQQKASITTNYNNLVNNIQTDLRFNDRQRNDAIKQATAAAQQHLSDLQSAAINYQSQAKAQTQQLALQMAQIAAATNPTANMQGILSQSIAGANQFNNSPQTASIYQPDLKKYAFNG